MLSKIFCAPLARVLLVPLCAALVGLALPARVGAAAAVPADAVVAGQIIVKLRNGDDLPALLTRHGLTLTSRFGTRPIFRLNIVGNANLNDTIAALVRDPAVLLAEPNSVHTSPEARRNLVWVIGSVQEYTSQWAPTALRLPLAHRRSRGAGVRVAVLDTGVDATHPALAGRLLPGFDFVDFDADPSEAGTPADAGYGHGTHVAGIVAMVAPYAQIMPLRVLNAQGQGDAWVLGEALLFAVDPDGNPATADGAQVISMSLGTLNPTHLMAQLTALTSCSFVLAPDPEQDFTDAGYNQDRQRCANGGGAVVVVAAGNSGSATERQYPAAENAYALIPVAATAPGRQLAGFSNSGGWIELAAPGDGITSTVPGGGYATWGGTSMAAPMVAGTVALVRSREPTLTPVQVVKRLQLRSAALCGTTKQRQIDAAAVLGLPLAADPVCP